MKYVLSFCFVMCAGFIIGCGGPESSEFSKSKDTWQLQVKSKKADHYKYTSKFQSWTGFQNETIIEVKANKVISRSYRAWENKGTNIVKGKSWVETGGKVGTNQEGAAAKTLVDLYQQCESEVLTKSRSEYVIDFKTHKNDLLHICQYRNKNCADDCNKGISVDSIKFLSSSK